MVQRIEVFNEIVGLIFAQLYQAFPVPITINEVAIAEHYGILRPGRGRNGVEGTNFGELPCGDRMDTIMLAVLVWLREEEFVRANQQMPHMRVVLTAKALTILNATPVSLGPERSLGTKLVDSSKGAASEAGRAAIGEIVGQVIGGFAKSMST